MTEPDLDLADEAPLRQLEEGQTLALAKLDQITEMLGDILQLLSPPPPEEDNGLHDLLARMAEALDRQGVVLSNLSATLVRIEQAVMPGEGV